MRIHGFCDTLWLFNIAIENGPFIVDFPIKTTIYSGFSMAMLNNQMVILVDVPVVNVHFHSAGWVLGGWFQDSCPRAPPVSR